MSFTKDTLCKCMVEPAVNFGERADHLKTDILLLHYTGMDSAEKALEWLCCEESGVSCHYFVFEDGRIAQLVAEEKRAWHAGKSMWEGEVDTNSRSIGIEIVNSGHSGDYPEFPDVQIDAVTELCIDILKRNRDIKPKNVLAHSDVAPGRKHDPGEKFPWQKLYENGVGHWIDTPKAQAAISLKLGDHGKSVTLLQEKLLEYGYGVEVSGEFCPITHDCVFAFQQHFRQELVDGIVDSSTMATLNQLLKDIT